MEHSVDLLDLVILEDDFDATTKTGLWSDAISFGDSISSHKFYLDSTDELRFADRLDLAANQVRFVEFSDTLSFVDVTHPRTHLETTSDQMGFVDVIAVWDGHALADTLTLSETWVGEAGTLFADTIVFTDIWSFQLVILQVISESLSLVEGISGYINDPWVPMVPIATEST